MSSTPSTDKNTVYEDEYILVFLAVDTTCPKQTIKNCKLYGKGLGICISESSAKTFCYRERWVRKLTTYFVWIKQEKKFVIIDAKLNGEFQYNNITKKLGEGIDGVDNKDHHVTKEELLKKFPFIENALNKNIFKSIDFQKKELEFFEKINSVKTILELKTTEDYLEYVAMPGKIVSFDEWSQMPTSVAYRVFKEYIQATPTRPIETRDIPENVLRLFPTLEYRYWNKVKSNAKTLLALGEPLSKHETKLWKKNPDEFTTSSNDFFSEKEIIATKLFDWLKMILGKRITMSILKVLNLDGAYETKRKKIRQYVQERLSSKLASKSLLDSFHCLVLTTCVF